MEISHREQNAGIKTRIMGWGGNLLLLLLLLFRTAGSDYGWHARIMLGMATFEKKNCVYFLVSWLEKRDEFLLDGFFFRVLLFRTHAHMSISFLTKFIIHY